MPDFPDLPNELLLDIAGLLNDHDLNSLTRTNRFFHALLNQRLYARAPQAQILRVITDSAVPSFLRFLSYGLLNDSIIFGRIPLFALCAHRPLILPHLSSVVDAKEWSFIVRCVPEGVERGMQEQERLNAGFREKAKMVRQMGARECEMREHTHTREWYNVGWGWLRWKPKGADTYYNKFPTVTYFKNMGYLPVRGRANHIIFKVPSKRRSE
jgi:hypothetical protein